MAINPLQAPISYAVDVKSPFEAALGGIKIGAGLEELEVARQKRALEAQQLQAAQAQQQQYQAGLNAFFAKPPADRRIEELQPLLVGANKQQFDALKLIGENMGAEKLASSKRFTSQVLLALESNPETAKTILQERIDVEADPNQKRAFQDILTIAKQNPEQASRLVESLGAGTFGEEWYKGITAVRTERRTAALQPAALKEAVAKADAAVADAEKKVAEAKDTPARLQAEQELRVAQTAQQQALTAASIGGEARAAAQAPEVLREMVAKADAAEADALRKVAEATDTPSRLEAEENLRQAQIAKEKALTAASVGGEARAAALAPAEVKEAFAKVDKAVADAKIAQATASNAEETAKADADLKRAQAQKAAVEAKYADQVARLGIRKTEEDIKIDREKNRIAALNAAVAKETNALKKQELEQKLDAANEKRTALEREQKALLANQVADIDNFINTAERIKQTPIEIIKAATGPIASRLPTTSQAVADFEALVETLGSQAFLAQIPKIKGTGNLTEKEGDKLQASLQNLSLKQSPERLLANVNEAVRLLEKARVIITARSGLPTIPSDVPARKFSVTVGGQTFNFPTQADADTFRNSEAYRRATAGNR